MAITVNSTIHCFAKLTSFLSMKRRHNNSVVLTYSICTAGQRLQPYKQLTTDIQLASWYPETIPLDKSLKSLQLLTSHFSIQPTAKSCFERPLVKLSIFIACNICFFAISSLTHTAIILHQSYCPSYMLLCALSTYLLITSFQCMYVEGGWWIHLPRSLPGSQCIRLGAREGGVSLCSARQFFFLYTISKVRIRKPTHFYWKES